MTATANDHATLDSDPEFRPDCTVRYDNWSGCGVNVQRRSDRQPDYVELTFLTRRGTSESHDLTLAQVEQLHAALDAVTRSDPPVRELAHDRGEPTVWVVPQLSKTAGAEGQQGSRRST